MLKISLKKHAHWKHVIPRVLWIVKLVLTSPVSSTCNEYSFSCLKLVYNHTTMSEKRLDFLLILFSVWDIVDK